MASRHLILHVGSNCCYADSINGCVYAVLRARFGYSIVQRSDVEHSNWPAGKRSSNMQLSLRSCICVARWIQTLPAIELATVVFKNFHRFLNIWGAPPLSDLLLFVVVCFPGFTTHFGCIFHSPVGGFILLIFKVSWSHTTTLHIRQDSSGQVINPSQRPLPDNTQHSQQTSMPPVGFEPTISAGERPKTYALDRTATGIGTFRPVADVNNV